MEKLLKEFVEMYEDSLDNDSKLLDDMAILYNKVKLEMNW